MSEERNFTTLLAPGSGMYPQRLTVVADLGQTHNSSLTLQHIVASRPQVTSNLQHHPLHSLLCEASSTIQGPSIAPAAEELSHVPWSMLRACMQHHAFMSAQPAQSAQPCMPLPRVSALMLSLLRLRWCFWWAT